jgi:hypothetical protein
MSRLTFTRSRGQARCCRRSGSLIAISLELISSENERNRIIHIRDSVVFSI